MAFPQGVDFRSTAAFVTDPTNFTHDLGTTVYPTASPQGNNIGWVSTSGLAARNRSAAVDPRLAGMVFGTNIASTFKIALPAAGTYNIRIALGDDSSTQIGQGIQILDGATVLATPVTYPASTSTGTFDDATGTNYSAANWPGSNTAVQLTFTGTVASFLCGGTGHAGESWAIASIYIESAGGGSFTASLSESGSAADSLSLTFAQALSLAESGAASDALSRTLAASRSLTEAGSAADVIARTLAAAIALAESGSASDALVDRTLSALAESGAASDTVTRTLAAMRTLLESGSATDRYRIPGIQRVQDFIARCYWGWQG